MSTLLVVPWDQENGGVASVVGRLARYLEAHGQHVLFLHPGACKLARRKKTKLKFDGLEIKLRAPYVREHPIRSVVAFILAFPLTLLQLVYILRKHQIRIVNIHYPGPGFVYFAFCRWLLPIKLVISIHGGDVLPWPARGPLSPTLRLVFREADLVVAPSRWFLQRCNGLLPPSSARRIVVHNGIDLAELQSSGLGKWGEVAGEFILSAASYDAWKGLDVLIRAVGLLRDGGERVCLLLAGEGPLRSQLESLTAALGLQEQVKFLGLQPGSAVARLLHECTLFVLPSRSESFGIAVIEALACSKPVVATAVGGIPEIIEDGTHGILVKPDDVEALAAAIRRLLADPTLREQLGRAGRRRVEDEFGWERMGEAYKRAYASLLADGA